MRIGIDFDNTIVNYESSFRDVAAGSALIDAAFVGGKRELRELIRSRRGEQTWMRLQAAVYGCAIAAPVYEGFFDFLERARAAKAWVGIISHKTEFSAAQPDGPNLRDAARGWLARQGAFERGVDSAAVYFEETREAKLSRIHMLACTHFIDDLPEVFLEPSFPARIDRILFAASAPSGPYRIAGTWGEVTKMIFDDSRGG